MHTTNKTSAKSTKPQSTESRPELDLTTPVKVLKSSLSEVSHFILVFSDEGRPESLHNAVVEDNGYGELVGNFESPELIDQYQGRVKALMSLNQPVAEIRAMFEDDPMSTLSAFAAYQIGG